MTGLLGHALAREDYSIARSILATTGARGILWFTEGDRVVSSLMTIPAGAPELEEKAARLIEELKSKHSLAAAGIRRDVDRDEASVSTGGRPLAWERIVPVFAGKECIGGCMLLSDEECRPDETYLDEAMMTLAISFKLGRQQRSIEGVEKRLADVAEIGPVFADAGDLDRSLNRLLDIAVRMSGAEVGAIMHFDKKGDVYFAGLPRKLISSIALRNGGTLLDHAVQLSEPSVFEGDRLAREIVPGDSSLSLTSLAVFPMFYDERRYGGMILINQPPGLLSDATYIATLNLISRLAAAAIASEERQKDAFFDSLTGLPNRRLFLDRAKQGIARSRRADEYRFTILAVGIDRFRQINESAGYDAGDQMLAEFSDRLMATIDAGDTLARLDGDEFAVLIEGGSEKAIALARRLKSDLETPFTVGGQEFFVTATMGIVDGTESYEDPSEILRDAETAMSRAKELGSGQYSVFRREMHEHALASVRLEAELRKGIERNEVVNFYQPIVSLAENRIVGFESLARWQHPVRGLVSPGEFIPVAESTGLIVDIGCAALKMACRQVLDWRSSGHSDVRVAVNVSARQLAERNLPEVVAGIIRETGVPVDGIKLEMTESLALSDINYTIEVFGVIREMGVEISLDDFGTGYSSLSYLSRLPVDYLKIDRSFIMDVIGNTGHMAVVRAIIALAHGLGKKVIAEGVETKEQLEFLRSERCDQVQGYFLGKPMPDMAATELLAKYLAA